MVKDIYATQLRNPAWQKKRLEILNRDNFTCALCSDTETELHIHHKEYKTGKKPWEYENDNFQTLCKHCHRIVEHFKDFNLTPIIIGKVYIKEYLYHRISTIFNSPDYGLVLCLTNYYDDREVKNLGMIERKDFKSIDTLFTHAEKLIK